MNIAMTIFAFIGVMCCALIGITLIAIAWYNFREWREKRGKKKNEM